MKIKEAVNVLFNEWKCIDRNDGINCDRKCESCDLVMDVEIIREAFNMAISALHAQELSKNSPKLDKENGDLQPTCNELATDTISRQAAIDVCDNAIDLWHGQLGEGIVIAVKKKIEELPSAQPEPLVKGSRTLVKNLVKDTISRQAAIDALWEIRQEEISDGRRFHDYCSLSTAVDVIKDLPSAQAEPCEDAVSRKAAIDAALSAFSRGLIASPDIRKLPSVQPEPQWIPVSERLPESKPEDLEYPTVIACCEDGEVMTACYYESTKEWGIGENYDRKINPVAWMPLPEPYRAERRTDGVDN